MSVKPLQLLSSPSQISCSASGALQFFHDPAVQVSVPAQVPSLFVLKHGRVSPSSSDVHAQDASPLGTQPSPDSPLSLS